ncbi:MAG: hypothetical protein JW860_05615 [Sedimentisphaerales bacterium]|nr:hypothetical protein [Sedimentisphaerales bacterium]
MSTPPSSQPDRGISSIAHLFLSQQRAESGGDTPRRRPPGFAEPFTAAEPPCSTDQDAPEELSNPFLEALHRHTADYLPGEILLADHLPVDPDRIKRFIRHHYQGQDKIALVTIDQYEVRLQQQDEPSRIIAETEDTGALITALNELTETYDVLVLNLDLSFRVQARDLIRRCLEVNILCTCESPDIITTYQTIKWLVDDMGWPGTINLFIDNNLTYDPHCYPQGDSQEHESAGVKAVHEVFDKLSGATRKFLDRELELIGFHISKPETINEEKKETPHDEEPCFENHLNMSQTKRKGHTREQLHIPKVHCPVEVLTPPCKDEQLSDALHMALSAWLNFLPGVISLPITPPADIDPAVKILLDGRGELYVMLPSLNADETILSRALRARKWLTDNLNLITSPFTQLQLDRTTPPALILVTGGPATQNLKISCSQLPDITSHVMQLHIMQSHDKWSLLILPA